MSYDIAIVIPPISADDQEAWDSLDGLIDQVDSAPPVFRTLHDRLTARYPCLTSLSDDENDDGVWSDGPLWNNFGKRAAVLGISFSRVDKVVPFVVESARSLGLLVFDYQTQHVHRPDGFEGVTLTLEERLPFPAPTIEQLNSAVDLLTPDGGPGFLILDGPGEDYAQVAGGDGAYTLEWRQYSEQKFRHHVAGKPGRPANVELAIPTNGFQVTVMENERLDSDDVKTLLTSYVEGKGQPTDYVWRDITERFT